jgi:hypothetical protein
VVHINIIEEIKNRLHKYPHVKYEASQNFISILPNSDNGFTVSLSLDTNEIVVSFNGWHEHFTDAEKALNCFAFGLSDSCRLKELRFLGKAYTWTVESQENGEWVEVSTTGLLIPPIWRLWQKPDVHYLQNHLIKSTNESVVEM